MYKNNTKFTINHTRAERFPDLPSRRGVFIRLERGAVGKDLN